MFWFWFRTLLKKDSKSWNRPTPSYGGEWLKLGREGGGGSVCPHTPLPADPPLHFSSPPPVGTLAGLAVDSSPPSPHPSLPPFVPPVCPFLSPSPRPSPPPSLSYSVPPSLPPPLRPSLPHPSVRPLPLLSLRPSLPPSAPPSPHPSVHPSLLPSPLPTHSGLYFSRVPSSLQEWALVEVDHHRALFAFIRDTVELRVEFDDKLGE